MKNKSWHIKNIFDEGELHENSTVMDYLTTELFKTLTFEQSVSNIFCFNVYGNEIQIRKERNHTENT